MPRPLRVHYAGAWYHVMNRGASRGKVFRNNVQRLIFLELLDECNKMFNLGIHAYCLMDNHYHLLIFLLLMQICLEQCAILMECIRSGIIA